MGEERGSTWHIRFLQAAGAIWYLLLAAIQEPSTGLLPPPRPLPLFPVARAHFHPEGGGGGKQPGNASVASALSNLKI